MDMPSTLPFSEAFDFASGATGERFQNPFWKVKEFAFGRPFREAVSEVRKFGAQIVSEAVRIRRDDAVQMAREKSDTVRPLQNNLIDSLLDHINDHQIVADAAMNYLSAGMLTSR